jgi:hypothetical protein
MDRNPISAGLNAILNAICEWHNIPQLVAAFGRFASSIQHSERVRFSQNIKDAFIQFAAPINTGATRVQLDLATLFERNPLEIVKMLNFFEQSILNTRVIPYMLRTRQHPETINFYANVLQQTPFANNRNFSAEYWEITMLDLINTVFMLRSVLNNNNEDFFAVPITLQTASLWIAELLYIDIPSYERLSDSPEGNADFLGKLNALVTRNQVVRPDGVKFEDSGINDPRHPSTWSEEDVMELADTLPTRQYTVRPGMESPAFLPLPQGTRLIPPSGRDDYTGRAIRAPVKEQATMLNKSMPAVMPRDNGKWVPNLGTTVKHQTQALVQLFDNYISALIMINDYLNRCTEDLSRKGGAKSRKSRKARKSKKSRKSKKARKSRKHHKRH